MFELPDIPKLLDVAKNDVIESTIQPMTPEMALEGIRQDWWANPSDPAKREEDYPWAWDKIAENNSETDEHECVVLITNDGKVQGACVYNIHHMSLTQENQFAVCLILLATAPWNRPWLIERPEFRGVGSALLFRAVCHSHLLGLKGRVVLEALNTERVTSFYENRGFEKLDETENATIWMEIPEYTAKLWIDRELNNVKED